MRLDDGLSLFRDHLNAASRSPRTITSYTQAIARALLAIDLSGDDWTSVTPIDLAEWRRQRATVAKPATVNLEVDALRQFYRWAVGEGLLPADPTTRLRHLPEGQVLAPKWLSRQDQHRLLRALQRAEQGANTERRRVLAARDTALVSLMLHTGLRVSETVGLDATDVSLSERHGAVTVRPLLPPVRSGVRPCRRGKPASVPLKWSQSATAARTLTQYGQWAGVLSRDLCGHRPTWRAP